MDFERVRSYWAAQTGTWLAVDLEAWERDHTMLLEFGWSLVRWDQAANEICETGHLIIKERMGYHNTTFVAGNRDVCLAVCAELHTVVDESCSSSTTISVKVN